MNDDQPNQLSKELLEFYKSLDTAVSIAVVSGKGGVGKTSFAFSQSVYAASNGLRVCLVDLDPEGFLTSLFPEPTENEFATSGDLFDDSEAFHKTIKSIRRVNDYENGGFLDLLGRSHSLRSAKNNNDPMLMGRLRSWLDDVGTKYDLVVIDNGGGSEGTLFMASMVGASHVVVPTELSVFGLEGTLNVLEVMEQIRKVPIPVPELVGLLPFKVERTSECRRIRDELVEVVPEKLIECDSFFVEIKKSAKASEAINNGTAPWDYLQRDEGSRAAGVNFQNACLACLSTIKNKHIEGALPDGQ